jgi:hypothetical protein
MNGGEGKRVGACACADGGPSGERARMLMEGP